MILTGRRSSAGAWPLHAAVWACVAWACAGGAAVPDAAARSSRSGKQSRQARRAAASEAVKEAVKAQATEQTATAATAVKAQDFATALKLLTDAYEQFPNPETLFQLGALAEGEGRTVEAQDLMRRYLLDPTAQPTPEVTAQAQRIIDLSRKPSGEVNVLGERGALVRLDGRPVGVLPLPLPLLVTAGSHVVVLEGSEKTMKGKIKVPDGRGAEMRFDAASGAVLVTLPPLVVVLAELPPVPAPAPSPPPPAGTPPNPTPAPPPPAPSPLAESTRRMRFQLEQAVRRANLALLNTDVARARAAHVAGCLTMLSCQLELARKSDADYVLRVRAERGSPAATDPAARSDWQITAALIDVEVGDVAASVVERCPGCTAEQAVTPFGTTVERTLERGLLRGRGTLSISTTPPGASVRLVAGDRMLGDTPLTRPLFAGPEPLQLEVSSSGYKTQRPTVTVREGKTESLSLLLQPELEPAPAPLRTPHLVYQRQPRPKWRLVVGSVSLVLGVGLGALGVSGLAIDGQCLEEPIAPKLACRQRYDTFRDGVGLTAAGAALTIGGIVLLAIPGPRRQVEVYTEEK